MKIKITFLALILIMTLFTGCTNDNGGSEQATPTAPAATTPAATSPAATSPAATTPDATTPDVVTTASIVDTAAAFEKAISSNGTWIIAITKDLELDKDLLLEGEYKNGKKDDAGQDIIQRKVALYAQDENRTITARYTLTAPKLTITSPKASIQHGTFKGDLYVSVSEFALIDATVDGNVYFSTEEAKSTFTMDETSKVTGTQEIKK